jgi:hypothetical protein
MAMLLLAPPSCLRVLVVKNPAFVGPKATGDTICQTRPTIP